MPHLTTDDGVKLYYEEVGSGIPIVFVHEFAGDYRSWEPQMRYFGRFYRCIAYNARGYPPSDVPETVDKYSQDRARDDIRAVLDALKIDKAHIIGLSMGGFATVHFGMHYHDRARSLVIAGCGYGAEPSAREQFLEETAATAKRIEELGMAKVAEGYGLGPSGVQNRRPSLYDLVDKMKTITAPALIMTGDEDFPCLQPGILMKRAISTAGLVVMPNAGHAINLEHPAAFNQHIEEFLHAVDVGAWRNRDPRAMAPTILGR